MNSFLQVFWALWAQGPWAHGTIGTMGPLGPSQDRDQGGLAEAQLVEVQLKAHLLGARLDDLERGLVGRRARPQLTQRPPQTRPGAVPGVVLVALNPAQLDGLSVRLGGRWRTI